MSKSLMPALFAPMFFAPLLFALIPSSAAHADGKVFVPLPDMSPLKVDPAGAKTLLTELSIVTVLGSNCESTSLSAAEHSLLTDGFDLLAYGELGLSVDDVVKDYETPAFDYLDTQPTACDEAPSRKAAALSTLEHFGGSLQPLPDQEKAYQDWRNKMDQIQN